MTQYDIKLWKERRKSWGWLPGVWGFPGGSAVKNPPVVQKLQETRVRSLSREDPLEDEMATHSSILTWKIPQAEEPACGVQSRGLQRAGHDWATKHTDKNPEEFRELNNLPEVTSRTKICNEFSSDAQSCPTLCNPMNHNMPGLPPSPTPRVHTNSCPSSWWCHPAISSSVVPFSSCPQSLPASVSQLFSWGGQSIGVSASTSVLPMNTQDWSPLW